MKATQTAGPTCLLAIAASLLLCAQSEAHQFFSIKSRAYGCIDPVATDDIDRHLGTARSARRHELAGRCFKARPGQRWEIITDYGRLPLVRLTPPRVGEPPLYFPRADLERYAPPSPPRRLAITGSSTLFPAGPTTGGAEAAPVRETAAPSPDAPDGQVSSMPLPPPAPPDAPASVPPTSVPAAPPPPPALASDAPRNRPTSSHGGLELAAAAAAVMAILTAAVASIWRRGRRTRDDADDWDLAQALHLAHEEISMQAGKLASRRQELTRSARGELGQARWSREVKLFCLARIVPLLDQEGLSRQWKPIEASVIDAIELAAREPPVAAAPATRCDASVFDPAMGRPDYDRLCAARLATAGWNARVAAVGLGRNPAILARKDGSLLVLSCRLAHDAVDETAVRELVAVRAEQPADVAAVVSNAPFTAAACRCAVENAVSLLHHDDLPSFSFAGLEPKLAPFLRSVRD